MKNLAEHGGQAKTITAGLRAARAFDEALALVLDRGRMDHQLRVLVVNAAEDARLIGLCLRLHEVRDDVAALTVDDEMAASNLKYDLANLAAFALIWATPGAKNYVRGCQRIADERQNQRELLAAGKIKDDVASPATPALAKFRVLFEECGEVAHAIDQVQHHGMAAGNIHAELIQVAAVCVAWLEGLGKDEG